ncbi:transporter substrate-binding domain-containing protein [Telmatospirillum siberiense]|uniref:Amino acid ABC transporter substrate-binding protein n=1 Tax=Telmatospirillum siberiense TaxID=382514 RepID=A0A2N3PVD3_9PROT|nr:transporter substrate-binding domain-containing protein [Telmatospirillum siberiense]PKU24350.1 amino acid ABC transporter substrate-binding protein [Telmatospirillum siberiense]
MKKIGLFCALAMLGMATAAHAATKVRIATEADYAPFEYKDADGVLKGFEIELGTKMCAAAKLDCEWVNMDFDAEIAALNAGKVDAILSQMSVTDERKKSVDFGDLLTIAPVSLVAKKGAAIGADAASLKGKTVGVQSGTTHETFMKKRLPSVAIKVYQSQEEAYLDLEAGRIDATLADKTIEWDWLQKTGKAEGFDYVGKDIDDVEIFGTGTAIAFRKGDAALRAKFNEALVQVLKDGTYKAINDKYFPFPINGK